jgi:ribosomal protein S12 methylthiotransferase accessory factor
MLGTLRAAGIDRAVVIDLTKDRIGIPVAKVVVPGLEAAPFVPGYVEGDRARRARREQS